MNYTPQDGFPYYLGLAQGNSLHSIYEEMLTLKVLHSLSEEQANYRYEPNKWSIKQVVGHISDHERIKIFRAFQLSRNEEVELWGYDQESLVNNSRFNDLGLQTLLTDFENVRKASMSFIDTLSSEQLQRKGQARQYIVTLEDFLRSIIGHERHHIHILQEKYLAAL